MVKRIKVANEHEFDDGSRIIEEIEGIEIAVFRINDEYHAIANFCPHQSGPLCEGQVTDNIQPSKDGWRFEIQGNNQVVACPWHGWRFDITSGQNLQSDRYSVPTYHIEVDSGEVFVTL